MPLSDKIGRLFKIGLPGSILDDETKRALDYVRPLAVIFFGRNIHNKEQLSRLIRDITAFLGYKPIFTIDQEGGIVTRLTEGFTMVPGPMALTATGDPENAYKAGQLLGAEMKALGIDWNLAPVVDINSNRANRGIGVRSFSRKSETVIQYAGRFIAGLEEAGILHCLKHFPGLGGVTTDPHLDLPILNSSREEIFRTDLEPFIKLPGDCWMPTHLFIPALQSKREAATISKEILTDLVRNELGFRGILVADDLNMGGISKALPPEQIVEASFSAGMDILSICEGTGKQVKAKEALMNAVRENENLQIRMEQSLERIDSVFSKYSTRLKQAPDLIGDPASITLSDRISAGTIKILKKSNRFPPLASIANIFAMSATRLVLIEDKRDGMVKAAVDIAGKAGKKLTEIPINPDEDEIEILLRKAAGKINMVFTENAHLNPGVSLLLSRMASASERLILIALRNPWDSEIEGITDAICTYGYIPGQQEALFRFIIDLQLS